jgi:hypothetical protein
MYALPQLSNALDDISEFEIPDFIIGEIVRFEPYYESDEGGVGIIKQITTCEFKNKAYDPQDPTEADYDEELSRNQLFISLPCAIVVSALPDEQWLDYVVLTNMEILTLPELIQEYANAFPEFDAIDLWTLRLQVAHKLSQYRYGGEPNNRNLSPVQTTPAALSVFFNQFGGVQ